MRYTNTTHPISWFMEREGEGNLVLQPGFQRRRVWTDRQKSNLMESILLGLPVPEIYMQVVTDSAGRSEYIVVDGQQRIGSILDFVGVNSRETFELKGLDQNSKWLGYSFSALTDVKKVEFYGHSMAVRYLQDATLDEIEDLFRRLNKYVTPLNPQELRNSTFKGPFLKLSENFADDSFWPENGLVTPASIRRMGDIEFVSDLIIGVLHGPQAGNARTIDDYYAMYEDYESEFPGQRSCRRRFTLTLELLREVVPGIRSTRWSNRTDFYTLFVATSHLLRDHMLPGDGIEGMRDALCSFADSITKFQQGEANIVKQEVIEYVDAVRRGSSDRYRRGIRHQAMLSVISPFFKKRQT